MESHKIPWFQSPPTSYDDDDDDDDDDINITG